MKEKGITLIALIVTIIVLIILAGITIATLTGDDGIINNANNAKEETEIANEKEVVDRATVQAMGNNKRGNIVRDELQDELDRITKVGDTEVKIIRKKLIVEFTTSHRMYRVDDDGNVFEYVYTDLPIMENGTDFNERMTDYREKVLTVTVLDNVNIPDNAYQIFDVSKKQDGTVKAWLVESEETPEMYDLYIGGNEGVDIENCSYLFSELTNCIEINLENLFTERVADFSRMFWSDTNLTNINIDNLDTNMATTMNRMFQNCSSLKNLDLSNFNTENLTDMYAMFFNCTNLISVNLSSFDTSNVINMGQLFNGCKNIKKLDLENFDVSKITEQLNGRILYVCKLQ